MKVITVSNLLSNAITPLVIDTSVLINLYACKQGEVVLRTIPNDKIIAQLVVDELDRGRRELQRQFLKNLLYEGVLNSTEMTDNEYVLFEDLTTIEPTIDDGEAATIAISVTRNLSALIDDNKGRKRAGKLAPTLGLAFSIDLFVHPPVRAALGPGADIETLLCALQIGRMQIPPERVDKVITLIGLKMLFFAQVCLVTKNVKLSILRLNHCN